MASIPASFRVGARLSSRSILIKCHCDWPRTRTRPAIAFSFAADAGALPFCKGVFDIALSGEGLTHTPLKTRALTTPCTIACAWPLSEWARFPRARVMYTTDHLDVWPLNPAQVRATIADYGMRPETKVKYLNCHSRLSHVFSVAHYLVAWMVIALEAVLARLPALCRLAIATYDGVSVMRAEKNRGGPLFALS
jgi:hypothetical protein